MILFFKGGYGGGGGIGARSPQITINKELFGDIYKIGSGFIHFAYK